jgi:hypothetical protein
MSHIDAILSDFTAGSVTFQLDIGNDGTWDWSPTPVSESTILPSTNLASAFNAYWQSQGAPPTGTLNVPIRVGFSTGGQVILTNLEMMPVNPTPTPTSTYTATNTPLPGATNTPTPTITNTPPPGATLTPTSLPSTTPTITNTPPPGATLTPTSTPTQPSENGEVFVPLVLRQLAFATPAPTPTLAPTCEVLDREPNNFFIEANGNLPLCEGSPVTGTVSPGDIDDIYRIEVATSGIVRIDLTNIPSGADYDLYLYNADRGEVTVSNTSGSGDESVRVNLPNGRYYIRVYSRLYAEANTYQLRWVQE